MQWRREPVVTSFYLDVDGQRYPRPSDYAPHVSELFRAAREHALRQGDDAAKRVDDDLARIANWLDTGLDRHVTRGVAAFAARGRFQALGLPVAVRDQVAIGPRPDVVQLCEVLAASGPVLVSHLGQQAAALVTGQMALSPSVPERELVAAAERLVEDERIDHQRAIVEKLHDRASQGEAAVTGLAPTLEALGMARAQSVIVEEGLELPGGRCLECGRLVTEETTCPMCGASVIPVGNAIAEAVSDAFLHHVTVEFCAPGSLADVGHIGAFERPSAVKGGDNA